MSMAPRHSSIETLGSVQLGSTQFSLTDLSNQADLNHKVNELTRMFKDQNNLVCLLLMLIDLIRDFGLGLVGEEKRMDECTTNDLRDSREICRNQQARRRT